MKSKIGKHANTKAALFFDRLPAVKTHKIVEHQLLSVAAQRLPHTQLQAQDGGQ